MDEMLKDRIGLIQAFREEHDLRQKLQHELSEKGNINFSSLKDIRKASLNETNSQDIHHKLQQKEESVERKVSFMCYWL